MGESAVGVGVVGCDPFGGVSLGVSAPGCRVGNSAAVQELSMACASLGVLGRDDTPRPCPSVVGSPSTAVPTTGTRRPKARTALCDQASSREGTRCTVAPAM